MPVESGSTTKNGKPVGYYRWGKKGKKYYYTPGNKRSRDAARARAAKQGRANLLQWTGYDMRCTDATRWSLAPPAPVDTFPG